ncbi:hypothetical protein TRIUR3_14165 [Triticum urartu]|uniref:Uncharacterized protein n=1 Tax=Triticum urartu TaxID=4572 RepID=M8ARY6_TRIUA|nr:hypothetical protein TRIUR3_14165 [Triticum urartu]
MTLAQRLLDVIDHVAKIGLKLGRRYLKQRHHLHPNNVIMEPKPNPNNIPNTGCVLLRETRRQWLCEDGIRWGPSDLNFSSTAAVAVLEIMNYFTYKATQTVLYQLYEMNPPAYTWLYNYLVVNDAKEGIHFLRALSKVSSSSLAPRGYRNEKRGNTTERQDLAERVMVTRLHLYGRWIKKCDHTKMYERISNENLELMRERLMETVVWPTDDTNSSDKQD